MRENKDLYLTKLLRKALCDIINLLEALVVFITDALSRRRTMTDVLHHSGLTSNNNNNRRTVSDRREQDPASYLATGHEDRRGFSRRRTDRRAGWDRRQCHSLEYFTNGGPERRSFAERRASGELRDGWVRISDWSSICITA